MKAWVLAARPKTLVAAFLPIAGAWALAQREYQEINYPILLFTLSAAICLQIATNFWNDYFDYKKGSDSPERLGPRRLLQQKMATPKQVVAVAVFFNLLAFLLAIPIFVERGWSLLLVGLICSGLSFAYTGGPWPLAYLGLGEIFVMLFFGWTATYFGYFVITGLYAGSALLLGTQIGFLSCTLITINNLRDAAEDKKNHKNTLVVRFGKRFGYVLLASEFLIPYALLVCWHDSLFWYLPFFLLPLALKIYKDMKNLRAANQGLALASLHALLFVQLWFLGI